MEAVLCIIVAGNSREKLEERPRGYVLERLWYGLFRAFRRYTFRGQAGPLSSAAGDLSRCVIYKLMMLSNEEGIGDVMGGQTEGTQGLHFWTQLTTMTNGIEKVSTDPHHSDGKHPGRWVSELTEPSKSIERALLGFPPKSASASRTSKEGASAIAHLTSSRRSVGVPQALPSNSLGRRQAGAFLVKAVQACR